MSFANAHTNIIDRSQFYEFHGDYKHSEFHGDYNHKEAKPGEHGIDELRKASCPAAFHDSRERYPPPRCLKGTRTDILREIIDWKDKANERILWISGPAGAGKTAIAQTVADVCANDSTLAGAFFLSGVLGCNTVESLIPSIAYQLIVGVPYHRVALGKIIESDSLILRKDQFTQADELIIPLFPTFPDATTNSSSHLHTPFLVIIDGLDECQGYRDQCDIVENVGRLTNIAGIPLRFMITSRPEPHIEQSFSKISCTYHHIPLGSAQLIDQAKNDIHTYLQHGFNQIRNNLNLTTDMFTPTDDTISALVQKSGGIFIYASTVLKWVGDGPPMEKLNDILRGSPGSMPFSELDDLYRRILGPRKGEGQERLFRVLTIILLRCQDTPNLGAPRIVSPHDIEEVLHLLEGTVMISLQHMHSIFNIYNMSFYHPTFTDFIINQERARECFIDIKQGHAFIARMLLQYISSHTDRDNVFQYSTWYWNWHCWESGRWDENPSLLENISKTLNLHESGLVRPIDSGGVIRCVQWFNIEEVQPPDSRNHPLEIQYRLFRAFWMENLLSFRSPIHIFTFYDEDHLMKDAFERTGSWMFTRYFPPRNRSRLDGHWQCYMFCESRKPFPGSRGWEHCFQDIFDPFVRRLLQEPGSLVNYNIDVIDGHVEVVHRSLEIFSKGYPTLEDEPKEYSYARRFWTRHLLHVPPGNRKIFDSLKGFDNLTLNHKLTADDILTLEAWLKSSGVGKGVEGVDKEWFERLGVFQELPQRSSILIAATALRNYFCDSD